MCGGWCCSGWSRLLRCPPAAARRRRRRPRSPRRPSPHPRSLRPSPPSHRPRRRARRAGRTGGGRAAARRRPHHRAGRRLHVDGQDDRLRQRVDLGVPAGDGVAVRRHARRQGRGAVARGGLRALGRPAHLHDHAAAGRALPQRPGDDLGRREVLDRRGELRHRRLGVDQRRHREHRDPGSLHRRRDDEVPVVADDRRPRAVQQRDHPGGLRRRDEGAVLRASDRHRPVRVGPLDEGLRPEAGPERQLLAGGQAVPRQRHVDRRRRRQHPHPAAQGRPDPHQRVPAVLLDRGPAGDRGRRHGAVPVHADGLPALQPQREAARRRARAARDLDGHRPPGDGRLDPVRQRGGGKVVHAAAGAVLRPGVAGPAVRPRGRAGRDGAVLRARRLRPRVPRSRRATSSTSRSRPSSSRASSRSGST